MISLNETPHINVHGIGSWLMAVHRMQRHAQYHPCTHETAELKTKWPFMVVRIKKMNFLYLIKWINRLVYNILWTTMLYHASILKTARCMAVLGIVVVSWRNFVSRLVCKNTQQPQRLRWYNRFIGESILINHHKLVSNVIGNNGKSLFDQLATANRFCTP